MYAALANQQRLLKEAAREGKKLRAEMACASAKSRSDDDDCSACISHMTDLVSLRAKYDANITELDAIKLSLADVSSKLVSTQSELELARAAPTVSDVLECDECNIFKSDLAALQLKYNSILCQLEELKSRPVLLGACKFCSTLRLEL